MQSKTLPPDATIRTVKQVLENPWRYAIAVLCNMKRCEAKHHNALVRIGVTGIDHAPHYKVVYYDGLREQTFGVFDCEHLLDPSAHERNWSTEATTLSQVEALLKEMIGLHD